MTEAVFDFPEINRRMNRKQPLVLPLSPSEFNDAARKSMVSVADLRAELDRTESVMDAIEEWQGGWAL